MLIKPVFNTRSRLEKNFAAVFRDLADGRMTQVAIAAKYRVSQQAVSQFAERNRPALDQAKAETVDYTKQALVADKGYRISELGDIYSKTREEYEAAESTSDRLAALKESRGTLRAVSEELGQLPRPDQNINIKAALLIRQIEGSDLGELS